MTSLRLWNQVLIYHFLERIFFISFLIPRRQLYSRVLFYEVTSISFLLNIFHFFAPFVNLHNLLISLNRSFTFFIVLLIFFIYYLPRSHVICSCYVSVLIKSYFICLVNLLLSIKFILFWFWNQWAMEWENDPIMGQFYCWSRTCVICAITKDLAFHSFLTQMYSKLITLQFLNMFFSINFRSRKLRASSAREKWVIFGSWASFLENFSFALFGFTYFTNFSIIMGISQNLK